MFWIWLLVAFWLNVFFLSVSLSHTHTHTHSFDCLEWFHFFSNDADSNQTTISILTSTHMGVCARYISLPRSMLHHNPMHWTHKRLANSCGMRLLHTCLYLMLAQERISRLPICTWTCTFRSNRFRPNWIMFYYIDLGSHCTSLGFPVLSCWCWVTPLITSRQWGRTTLSDA
jgi:hypothetical protein